MFFVLGANEYLERLEPIAPLALSSTGPPWPPCPPGSDGPEEDDFDDAVIIISTDDEEPRLLDIPRDTCDNNAKLNHSSNYVPTLGGVNQMILDPHSFPT